MSLKNLAKLINQASKEQTPAERFLRELNETISRLDSENSRPPSRTYKPSMLGGCSRQIFFLVEGFKEDEGDISEASFVGICESGSDRHERIQKAISEMQRLGYKVEWVDVAEYLNEWAQPGTEVVAQQGMETKLYNKILNMSFLCDGIIKIDGKYFILEIKTEASFKWNGRVAPVEKHISQATAYATCLGINDIMFVYENRDFCSKKAFHHIVTETDKQELIIGKIEEIENFRSTYKETNIIPPKSTKQSDCNYCSYKRECKLWEQK